MICTQNLRFDPQCLIISQAPLETVLLSPVLGASPNFASVTQTIIKIWDCGSSCKDENIVCPLYPPLFRDGCCERIHKGNLIRVEI